MRSSRSEAKTLEGDKRNWLICSRRVSSADRKNLRLHRMTVAKRRCSVKISWQKEEICANR